jgi:hypothetical protein
LRAALILDTLVGSRASTLCLVVHNYVLDIVSSDDQPLSSHIHYPVRRYLELQILIAF